MHVRSATARGVSCGIGAAFLWAVGFVAARHGIAVGMSPLVLALDRFVWPGLALLPLVAGDGFRDFRAMGWRRGIVLSLFGGVPLALLGYAGFLFVPLAHGGVIQPSCAALGGLGLAALALKEPLPSRRIAGALVIVVGLGVIGVEAIKTMGVHGLIGDLLFAAAGGCFAIFGMLLRLWRIEPIRATVVTSVLSLAFLPILSFGLRGLIAAGLAENLLQIVVQGAFTGPVGIYLFTRAVELLGAGRAALFPSLVPPFTLLIGLLAIAEVPTVPQLAGLALVLAGFRLTQKE